MITRFKIVGKSFKKLDNPFMNENSKKYIFYVNIKDVPDGIPMDTNPREQKLSSGVAKAIEESLISNDGFFHLKNRGIVLSAKRISFNNQTDEVELEFTNAINHGNIDGGHTYKVICKHKNDANITNQYVQFEIMTGVESIIEPLARARNTSIQVDEKSLAELSNNFEPIKECIRDLSFYRRISFKMNQTEKDSDGKNLKMIDCRDIISIINLFDINDYNDKNHPIQSYSSKEKVLEKYLVNIDYYKKFTTIAKDIFNLYDLLENDIPTAYNKKNNRKYGKKKFSKYNDNNVVGKSKFFQKDLHYIVPTGILYPVLGAFRSLVILDSNTGKYKWSEDPFDVWENTKIDLVDKIMSYSSSTGDNPTKLGKDSNAWSFEYMTIQVYTK